MEEKISYNKKGKEIIRSVEQTGPVIIAGENLGNFKNTTYNFINKENLEKLENYFLDQKNQMMGQVNKIKQDMKGVEYIASTSWKDEIGIINQRIDKIEGIMSAKKFNSKTLRLELKQFGATLTPLRDYKSFIQMEAAMEFTQTNIDKIEHELDQIRKCKK